MIPPTLQEGRWLLGLPFLFFFSAMLSTGHAYHLASWLIQVGAIFCGLGALTGGMLYHMNPHELTFKRAISGTLLMVGLAGLSWVFPTYWEQTALSLPRWTVITIGGYLIFKTILPYAYRLPWPDTLTPTHQYEALYIEPAPMPRTAFFTSLSLAGAIGIVLVAQCQGWNVASFGLSPGAQLAFLLPLAGLAIWVAKQFYRMTLLLYKAHLYSLGHALFQGIRQAVVGDSFNMALMLTLGFWVCLRPDMEYHPLLQGISVLGVVLVVYTQWSILVGNIQHMLGQYDAVKQNSLSNQQIHIDLAVKTAQLEVEVEQHAQAKRAVEEINAQLEHKVHERTRDMQLLLEELASVNTQLESELHERKVLESQLIQSQKLESIGQLAAGVAHEINNPVGFILSNLNTLSDYVGVLTQAVKLYQELEHITRQHLSTEQEKIPLHNLEGLLERIKSLHQREDLTFILDDLDALLGESIDGSKRVKDIVQGLKSFSRVDESQVKEANINDCLDATLKVVWNELKYKCIVYKQYGEIPELLCNPGHLNQVFMNLFVNAADAIDKQGDITVKTWHDTDHLYVAITDTGSGMTDKQLEKIFDPFYTTKPVGKGSGLGLAISYGIIQKHGGSIDVRTELSRGTTFTVMLPKHPPHSLNSSSHTHSV